MEYMSRILEISVESAENLPNVRHGGKSKKVFTKVSIAGRPDTEKKTTVDEICGSNPIWNCQMKFTINEDILLTILFEIHCVCFAGKERLIGEVRVPVRDLADKSSVQVCRYPVTPVGETQGAGERQGELIFTYIFRQGAPSPPPEKGQPNQQENGHVPGRKRDFLKTVAAKIGVAGAVTAVVTAVTNDPSNGGGDDLFI